MMDEKPLPRFLSEKEVAKITGVSVSTLQRWRLLGKAPTFKRFHGSVRYSEAEIARFLNDAPTITGPRRYEK
jgi:predicted site-specific integrase-resolvase